MLRITWFYVALSVVAGPVFLILGAGVLTTRGGGDYCDAGYRLPTGGWDPAREGEFASAHTLQVALSALALLIGVVLLVLLLRRRRELAPVAVAVAGTALVVIMLGYASVALVFGSGGHQCSALAAVLPIRPPLR